MPYVGLQQRFDGGTVPGWGCGRAAGRKLGVGDPGRLPLSPEEAVHAIPGSPKNNIQTFTTRLSLSFTVVSIRRVSRKKIFWARPESTFFFPS